MIGRAALLANVLTYAYAVRSPPSICTWDPVLPVTAGSRVSARVYNPLSERCEAVLRFDDTTFLSLSWSFAPMGCVGSEILEIVVPPGVPNGDAYITWDCAGDNAWSCVHVNLTNGLGDLDSTAIHQIGVARCAPQPTTGPTTLSTSTTAAKGGDSPTSDVLGGNTGTSTALITSSNTLFITPTPGTISGSQPTRQAAASESSTLAAGTGGRAEPPTGTAAQATTQNDARQMSTSATSPPPTITAPAGSGTSPAWTNLESTFTSSGVTESRPTGLASGMETVTVTATVAACAPPTHS